LALEISSPLHGTGAGCSRGCTRRS